MIQQTIKNTKLLENVVDINDFFDIPCFDCVLNPDLSYLQNFGFQKWASAFDKYVVFGTGGSALGGKAIKAFLAPFSTVIFIDNLDYDSFKNTLENVDIASTGFLVISKSGETIETIAQMLTSFNLFGKDEIKYHFFCITEDKDSTIKRICKSYDILTIDHPKDIGGRFSVFSSVGMTVAYLMGLDCNKFIDGAQNAINDLKKDSKKISFLHSLYSNGIHDIVFMSYSEKFNELCMWIRQLIAESTGKGGEGITPITAIGPVDQHSQLQLYLGGQKNKGFTFFIDKSTIDTVDEKLKIQCLDSSISFLNNKTIQDLIGAEAVATIDTLCEANIPVRIFEVESFNEKILGYIFMCFMLEVVYTCIAIGVNPFDQPHVERIKILTKQNLN